MKTQFRHRRIRCGLAAIAATVNLVVAMPVSAQTKSPEGWQLTIPTRRATSAAPAGPPPLPASADSIAATTVELIVSRRVATGRPSIVRHTVSRTADRIHIVGSDRREWLFERNPIDRRRVSATLVAHAAEAIILYAESDLRMTLGIRGWADVLAFGLDLESLDGYKRTADVRTLAGIQFARYVTETEAAPITEVWWSNEQALASQFVIRDPGVVTEFTLERVRLGTDVALLNPPQNRFPRYRVVDYADWLEKH